MVAIVGAKKDATSLEGRTAMNLEPVDCDEFGARDVEVGSQRGLAVLRRPQLLSVGRV